MISKTQQKELTGGGFGHQICPQFLPCWSDNDCPCGSCGVRLSNGLWVDDLCAF